ncbi:MazG nucleotide pyrophosphohydrolase domain-containing protein [Psychromonas sp. KJ10-10]|uniref:MazG nucleotide pyrophosphohydrolase domain-containing protein n=1 Tax=Psychromonas sp. KJ10-10 TaxID=3391823 RepID=UPI0039B47C3E
MKAFDILLDIAKRKAEFDKDNSWSNGSTTYLAEIKKEVDEVIEEIPKSRLCYLEDELGDILWDYLNILTALQQEKGIEPEAVLKRACQKYEQRVSGIEAGQAWSDIKIIQKQLLETEHQCQIEKGV